MKRRIIQIDESKCTGCGLCVNACHEGAIKLVNSKDKLIRDDYCDGLEIVYQLVLLMRSALLLKTL